MSGMATANPPTWAPWRSLLQWAPFKIDALGLVTLLGAEEVNGSVGRLVRSRWLEYLPFLGAYVVAGNRIREKEPGFNLYNITQGIHSTDLAPWLTRWIKSQGFTKTRSFVRWTVIPHRSRHFDDAVAMVTSICLLGFLLALTILSYDMYGMGSTLAMAWSVVVRWFMVRSIRQTIDRRVSEMCDERHEDGSLKYVISEDQTFEGRLKEWKSRKGSAGTANANNTGSDPEGGALEKPHRLACGWNGQDPAKVMVITSEALAITMMVPRELMGSRTAFNENLPVAHRLLYGIARWTGWIAFAVQVVTIGQADLVTQICTVALLVIPTVLHVGKFGCDDSNWAANISWAWRKFWALILGHADDAAAREKSHYEFSPISVSQIGSRLQAEVYEWPLNHDFIMNDEGKVVRRSHLQPLNGERTTRRQHLYAWLQLSEPEQDSMDKWDLFPHERDDNQEWTKKYEHLKELISELSSPVGSIRGIKGTPIVGAQDLIDGSTAAINAANGSAALSPASTRTQVAPNGTVGEPQTLASGQNTTTGQRGTAQEETDPVEQLVDDIPLRQMQRTGTTLTSDTAQSSIRQQTGAPGTVRRRRDSTRGRAAAGGLSERRPLGTAFMVTNETRWEHHDQPQEASDSEATTHLSES